MNLNSPPILQNIVDQTGAMAQSWVQFFTQLYQILLPIRNSGTSTSYAPTTGTTVTIPAPIETCIATPAANLNALTLALPTQMVDGQPVYFITTKDINVLTITSSNATVSTPTTFIQAGHGVSLRYVKATNTWYRFA